MIASVATTAGLSALRSAEGLSPQRGGGGTMLINNTPSASLPIGSSVAQGTALPSLGTAWHLANPLKDLATPPNIGGQYRGLDNSYIIPIKQVLWNRLSGCPCAA